MRAIPKPTNQMDHAMYRTEIAAPASGQFRPFQVHERVEEIRTSHLLHSSGRGPATSPPGGGFHLKRRSDRTVQPFFGASELFR
jgi:hypothetical protein